MGFYDGQGLTTRASAWELADTLGLPVLLVVQPGGASVTLAAEIQGLVHFRKTAIFRASCSIAAPKSCIKMLKDLLERETGLPVLGYLPRLPQAAVESRHLGLKTAGEITDIQEKIALLADRLVMDWEKLAAVTERPCPRGRTPFSLGEQFPLLSASPWRGTELSALHMLKRWTLCGRRARSLYFSARCGILPCRRESAGCICPAATRSCMRRP